MSAFQFSAEKSSLAENAPLSPSFRFSFSKTAQSAKEASPPSSKPFTFKGFSSALPTPPPAITQATSTPKFQFSVTVGKVDDATTNSPFTASSLNDSKSTPLFGAGTGTDSFTFGTDETTEESNFTFGCGENVTFSSTNDKDQVKKENNLNLFPLAETVRLRWNKVKPLNVVEEFPELEILSYLEIWDVFYSRGISSSWKRKCSHPDLWTLQRCAVIAAGRGESDRIGKFLRALDRLRSKFQIEPIGPLNMFITMKPLFQQWNEAIESLWFQASHMVGSTNCTVEAHKLCLASTEQDLNLLLQCAEAHDIDIVKDPVTSKIVSPTTVGLPSPPFYIGLRPASGYCPNGRYVHGRYDDFTLTAEKVTNVLHPFAVDYARGMLGHQRVVLTSTKTSGREMANKMNAGCFITLQGEQIASHGEVIRFYESELVRRAKDALLFRWMKKQPIYSKKDRNVDEVKKWLKQTKADRMLRRNTLWDALNDEEKEKLKDEVKEGNVPFFRGNRVQRVLEILHLSLEDFERKDDSDGESDDDYYTSDSDLDEEVTNEEDSVRPPSDRNRKRAK
eukprot:g890.t1